MSQKTKRKAISKSDRYDVFKRDKFTCQYCGRKAPDVVLQIDHIVPVSKGGTNEILNYITSCADCNSGKSNKVLDENIALSKQRDELDRLAEKREQIEMLMSWKIELSKTDNTTLEMLIQFWESLVPGVLLNKNISGLFSPLLKKHGIEEVTAAMEIAASKYVKYKSDGNPILSTVENALNALAPICHSRVKNKDKPYIGDLYYIFGILRNRFGTQDRTIVETLEEQFLKGVPIEEMKEMAREASSLQEFLSLVYAYQPTGEEQS